MVVVVAVRAYVRVYVWLAVCVDGSPAPPRPFPPRPTPSLTHPSPVPSAPLQHNKNRPERASGWRVEDNFNFSQLRVVFILYHTTTLPPPPPVSGEWNDGFTGGGVLGEHSYLPTTALIHSGAYVLAATGEGDGGRLEWRSGRDGEVLTPPRHVCAQLGGVRGLEGFGGAGDVVVVDAGRHRGRP